MAFSLIQPPNRYFKLRVTRSLRRFWFGLSDFLIVLAFAALFVGIWAYFFILT